MKNFKNILFDRWESEGSNSIYENLMFEKCTFQGIKMRETLNPQKRNYFKNITLSNCIQTNCIIEQAIFENLKISNLNNKSLVQSWGALFKNCVFEGKIGRIMLSENVTLEDVNLIDKFKDSSKDFYKNINLAIDISKAEFLEFDNRCIPAQLIKRDPETQVIIKRNNLLKFNNFNTLVDFEETNFNRHFELFMERNLDDMILIAPKMNKKKFPMCLRVINRLVEINVAER
jgi:uncharacterized protein YjbI with pentapeptide repeats